MFSNPLFKANTMSQLFSVKGRLGRSMYQNQYLLSLGVVAFALLVYELKAVLGFDQLAFNLVICALTIAFLSMITAAIRRLHDLDRPAWHLVLALIPVYNLYLLLSLLCIKGENEVNPYGLRPEAL